MEPATVPPPMSPLLQQAPSVLPGTAETAQQTSEVENAVWQLAQNLRQRRPAANGIANGTTGSGGAVIRS